MYDMSTLVKRYFTITLDDGRTLELEPPKLKVLKKISQLSKLTGASDGELTVEDIESLSSAIALSLSKNKSNVNITPDEVEDMFDIDGMYDFLTKYFGWVSEIQSSKN